jgi:hypothetical protein
VGLKKDVLQNPINPTQRKIRADEDAPLEEQWEYLAANLKPIPGAGLESFFNDAGYKGWEFVSITGTDKDHYALFKRRRREADPDRVVQAVVGTEEIPTPEERQRNREQARGT